MSAEASRLPEISVSQEAEETVTLLYSASTYEHFTSL